MVGEILNGDFETGDLTSWDVFDSNNNSPASAGTDYKHNGSYGLRMKIDPINGDQNCSSDISQTVYTPSGYRLKSVGFWYRVISTTGHHDSYSMVNLGATDYGSQPLLRLYGDEITPGDWIQVSIECGVDEVYGNPVYGEFDPYFDIMAYGERVSGTLHGVEVWYDDFTFTFEKLPAEQQNIYGAIKQNLDLTGVTSIDITRKVDMFDDSISAGELFMYVLVDDTQVYEENITAEESDTVVKSAPVSYSGTHLVTIGLYKVGGWQDDNRFAVDLYNVALTGGSGVTAPVSNFTGTPVSGTVPFSVAFTDSSTNTPTGWAWDFGDGGTSTEQNPTHVYKVPGVYDVSLVATNSGGSDTETKTDYINAGFGSPSISTYQGRRGLGINTEGGAVPWGV